MGVTLRLLHLVVVLRVVVLGAHSLPLPFPCIGLPPGLVPCTTSHHTIPCQPPFLVGYGMVEVCEGAPVAVSGWVLTDSHDLAPCAANSLHRVTISVNNTIRGLCYHHAVDESVACVLSTSVHTSSAKTGSVADHRHCHCNACTAHRPSWRGLTD